MRTPKQRARIYREAGMLLENKDLAGITKLFMHRADKTVFPETMLFFDHHLQWCNKNSHKKNFDEENNQVRSLIFYLLEHITLNP